MLHVFPEAYQWKWSSFKLHFLSSSTRSEKGSILPPVPPGLIVAVLWVTGSSWSRLYWDRRLAESQLMKSLGRFVAVESFFAVCPVPPSGSMSCLEYKCYFKNMFPMFLQSFSGFFAFSLFNIFFLPKFQNSHGKEGILKTL